MEAFFFAYVAMPAWQKIAKKKVSMKDYTTIEKCFHERGEFSLHIFGMLALPRRRKMPPCLFIDLNDYSLIVHGPRWLLFQIMDQNQILVKVKDLDDHSF